MRSSGGFGKTTIRCTRGFGKTTFDSHGRFRSESLTNIETSDLLNCMTVMVLEQVNYLSTESLVIEHQTPHVHGVFVFNVEKPLLAGRTLDSFISRRKPTSPLGRLLSPPPEVQTQTVASLEKCRST